MTDFRACLESITRALPGSLTATLMGMDGLPVDSIEVEQETEAVDFSSLLVEYSAAVAQIRQSAQFFSAGSLDEVTIRSEHVTTIIRPVTEDYFLALAVRPGSLVGKGRYLLRIHGPKLVADLS